MDSIKYCHSVFEAQVDKTTVEETRKISFVIAAEVTGAEHRNKFNYNWDNWSLSGFNANPIVGYQHNVYGDNMCVAPNPDDVIGKANVGMDTFRGKRALIAETTFEPKELNSTAEKVFRKVLWGSLNATSVGVNPIGGDIKRESIRNANDQVVDYRLNFPGQELVEFSIVNIPADPAALRRSLKSHTISALNFLQRSLPELSMNDMRTMKVQEILDLFESKKGQLELDLTVAQANYDKKLSEILNKYKHLIK